MRPPTWLWIPAAGAVLVVVVPLLGLLTSVDVGSLWPLLTSEASVTALLLSLRTAVIATALCLVLGAPLALLLARGQWWGQSVLRALVLVPLVLPPVVGGLALLTTFGRRGLLGEHLFAAGISISYTTTAVVLGQLGAPEPLWAGFRAALAVLVTISVLLIPSRRTEVTDAWFDSRFWRPAGTSTAATASAIAWKTSGG